MKQALEEKWIDRRHLAIRWDCTTKAAGIIAKTARLRWKKFGKSKNASIKYLFIDVLKYEGVEVTA